LPEDAGEQPLSAEGFSGTVNDSRFMFWLAPYAAAGDQFYIDDVSLVKQ
jgi:hypothetical protein